MDDVGLRIGWRSALLGAAILQCLLLAAPMAGKGRARPAEPYLGGALVTIAGCLLPYALGFAGAFDAWRGLTFLPVALPAALGPFLYLYARTLASGPRSGPVRVHFLLPGVQWTYLVAAFLLPLDLKWAWYTGGHRIWIAPIFDLLAVISLTAYATATAACIGAFRRRLAEERSDDDRFALTWLKLVLAALSAGVALQAGFWLWSLASGGINYFQETGLYLGLGLLGVYLGVEGRRFSALPLLSPGSPGTRGEETPPDALASTGSARSAVDWACEAAAVEARVLSANWWRESDLSLSGLARRIGTNTGRLSRIINLGLGLNFSTFINRMRAEGVAAAIRDGDGADLFALALDMGFASKASFNRAFRAHFGISPSQYRASVSNPAFPSPAPELRRGTRDAVEGSDDLSARPR
jgi:AraC-like DNA-binding protein